MIAVKMQGSQCHCERNEMKRDNLNLIEIASSFTLLAMTGFRNNPVIWKLMSLRVPMKSERGNLSHLITYTLVYMLFTL